MSKNEEVLAAIGLLLESALEAGYEMPMHFILLVTPAEIDSGSADYISSGHREDCIKWLRETADRLELRQDIPRTEGSA